ncbi:ribbon-helix-helix domain-containing protein [Bradyrhizobium japonicum]|uniref:ribbon-helix-helix domain-containing protein n=1 Tax=Bradyrhizobium japonicum TaxID=375 RepID=UPI001BAAE6F7|nr:ribbon-helix-helix domain-containing protein [Bradyrhizobium japonicum]MBR0960885.1 CopG family transcriptional regulator [Bradyrhizobium japonicum]
MNKLALPKKPRTTATLTAEQGRLLRLMAERQKVSVSWLIRHAVERLIEEESKGLQLPLDMPVRGMKKD